MKVFRHGDVIIRKVNKLPKELIEQKHNKLAEGEYTGHSHQLMTKNNKPINILKDEQGNIYIDLKEAAKVTHQEHKVIELEPAQYEVIIKRNFDPFTEKINQVKD